MNPNRQNVFIFVSAGYSTQGMVHPTPKSGVLFIHVSFNRYIRCSMHLLKVTEADTILLREQAIAVLVPGTIPSDCSCSHTADGVMECLLLSTSTGECHYMPIQP